MLDFKAIQKEVQENWDKIDLYAKLKAKNSKGLKKFFLDGPPYANNVPHVGHVRNTVYKDLYIRQGFMKGWDMFFQPGFDTHGLPVENAVEKKLGLKSKKDIFTMGVDKFTEECKNHAILNKDVWLEAYEDLGSVYAWKKNDPYVTFANTYVQSGWWSFKKCWERDLIYEGKKPVFWCPKCETSLAGYEATDSYAMLTDPSIFVKFKLKGKDDYLLVFTTTPWTLISNTAIAASPDADYVKVDTLHGNIILAKNCLALLTQLEMGFTILEEFKGKKLDGLEYEPLLDVPQQKELLKNEKAHKVYMSIPILKERVASKIAIKRNTTGGDLFEEFVSVDSGTGLVHTVPGAGKTDNEFGKYYGLPEISPLDDECKFTEMAGEFEGIFVKDADQDILKKLENENKLLYSSRDEHRYPVCWRCKAPLIFRMSDQLFLKLDPLREKLLEFNKHDVNWYPEFAKERFLSWVINAEDWNISRQRFWGIPIPLWTCECGEKKIIGSVNELKEHAVEQIPEDFDLHNVGGIHLKCKCGKDMDIRGDIFDVWFDSGIAPWASVGYPYTNKDLIDERFPIFRINEAQDQIRGWFYSLAVMAAAVFDKPSYNNVSMTGWVVDAKGDKMSKSVGNVVDALALGKKYGGDMIRMYYIMDVAPYSLQKFNEEIMVKEIGRFMNTFLNMNRYLKGSNFDTLSLVDRKIEDDWILSRLNSLIKFVNEGLNSYELHHVGRAIIDFVLNDLSRGYVQYVRDRFDEDPVVTAVIAECMHKLSLLMAPMMPFVTDRIFMSLKEKFGFELDSVHLGDYPKADENFINIELEKKFELMKGSIEGLLALREDVGFGIRWPLKAANIYLYIEEDITITSSVIKRQCNVKAVKFQNVKKDVGNIVRIGGFNEGYVTVDATMDAELELEGYTREFIRRVQMERKKLKLVKNDVIELSIEGEFDISTNVKDIEKKVGARVKFEKSTDFDKAVEFKIKGKVFNFWVKKV